MRKEVVFAIIIGLILGLVILYGIQLANQSTKQAANSSLTPTPTETVSQTPAPGTNQLTITSPQNHAVVNTGSIKITGKTAPNSSVAISDTEDDALVTADKDGNFTVDLKLAGGSNTISLTSLKPDLTTDTAKITVIYTTAKID